MVNLTRAKRRLDAWCKRIKDRHVFAGRLWYRQAHDFAQRLADEYGVPLNMTCGLIAILSPGCAWEINCRDAESLLQARKAGVPPPKMATYKAQEKKALALLDSPPLGSDSISVLVAGKYGPKTRAFYWNILRPEENLSVTIDRWIIRALLGVDAIRGGNHYKAVYPHLAELMRHKALEANLVPCEFQAILWHCVKDHLNGRQFSNVKSASERIES